MKETMWKLMQQKDGLSKIKKSYLKNKISKWKVYMKYIIMPKVNSKLRNVAEGWTAHRFFLHVKQMLGSGKNISNRRTTVQWEVLAAEEQRAPPEKEWKTAPPAPWEAASYPSWFSACPNNSHYLQHLSWK